MNYEKQTYQVSLIVEGKPPYICEELPEGFIESMEHIEKRDPKYHSLNRDVSQPMRLGIRKGGGQFILDTIKEHSLNAKIVCLVKELNRDTYEYEVYLNALINCINYKERDYDVEIDFIDNSPFAKIKRGDKLELSYTNNVDIEGGIIATGGDLVDLNINTDGIVQQVVFADQDTRYSHKEYKTHLYDTGVINWVDNSQGEHPYDLSMRNVQINKEVLINEVGSELQEDSDTIFTNKGDVDAVLDIDLNYYFKRDWGVGVYGPRLIKTWEYSQFYHVYLSVNDVNVGDIVIIDDKVSGKDEHNYGDKCEVTKSIIDSIIVPVDGVLKIHTINMLKTEHVKYSYADTSKFVQDTKATCSFKFDKRNNVTETQTKAIKPFDAFERLIKQICGKNTVLESAVLKGRLKNMLVTSGFAIRNFPIEKQPIILNLSDLWDTFSRQFGLAMYYSRGQFFIEDINTVYEDSDELYLSNVTNFELSPNKNVLFNKITNGIAKKQDYGTYGAVEEFNTKTTRSAQIPQNKTLNLTLPYNTDGQGVEVARLSMYKDNGTKDSKQDNNIYIIDSYEDVVGYFARTNKDLTVENLFNPVRMNLLLTPSRALIANAILIYPSLQQGKLLRFNSSVFNSDLNVWGRGIDAVQENDNIVVTEEIQFNSRYSFMTCTFDTMLNSNEIKVLSEFKHSMIDVRHKGKSHMGYIDNFTIKEPNGENRNSKEVSFELMLNKI